MVLSFAVYGVFFSEVQFSVFSAANFVFVHNSVGSASWTSATASSARRVSS